MQSSPKLGFDLSYFLICWLYYRYATLWELAMAKHSSSSKDEAKYLFGLYLSL